MELSTRLPSRTSAAEVSSQLVSMAKIIMR
jgi:hypothetical protein